MEDLPKDPTPHGNWAIDHSDPIIQIVMAMAPAQ
jgi:hypothetical protein